MAQTRPLDTALPDGVRITGPALPDAERVLTAEALAFVAELQRTFGGRREALLAQRAARQRAIDAGERPAFRVDTAGIRAADWRVAEPPPDLLDRRVEITGPAERKMMINALNSRARVFMADLEDALSPSWENVIAGHANLRDAVRRTLTFDSPDGRPYRLAERTATLLARPRGWHLVERHAEVDGAPISAGLFDFGLFFFHNGAETLRQGSGPYVYLPKLEGHEEARLWNDVFLFSQDALGIPRGSVRATVLVENVLAAFEMDEILYELREHSAGLNAGRWDYLFSIHRKFRRAPDLALPDRAQLSMTVPFMRAYTDLLVRTCHRRGAHAIGGMAAFIPTRRNPELNATALAKVRDDKRREAGDGFDGTWVAHPDLVPVAADEFDRVLGDRPDQRERLRADVAIGAQDLLGFTVPGGRVTEAGVRTNVSVALLYLDSWLRGNGAAALFNLMEDTATAEISRSQLWHWIQSRTRLDDGRSMSRALYASIRDEELARYSVSVEGNRLTDAAALLDTLVLGDDFPEFLTLVAYPLLG